MIKINVLGGCVSRVSLLDGHQSMHGIADEEMELGYFLDKQNIVCAMMPAPFEREEVERIEASELWDQSRLYTVKQCLNKDTMCLLMESDADYVVMDLYDMQTDFAAYKQTCFSTCANEVFNTRLLGKYFDKVSTGNFLGLPPAIWYGYVDLFFEKLVDKYGADHIILNRFRCNSYYLAKDGIIREIPKEFQNPFQPHPKYNIALAELEDYIIEKYNPYVIDLSKYFMGDQNAWNNLQGAHFENEFYRETFDQIKKIVKGKDAKRYFSEPKFFDENRRGFEEDKNRKFEIESNMQLMLKLLDQEDILWLNILDKLKIYAPDDKRVQEYVSIVQEM